MKNLIKKFSLLLSQFNKVIPKKKNRIVLYSNIGFRDNVEALYRYLIREGYNRKYAIICSTNEWKKYSELNQIKNVKFVNCYIGVYYFFTSKYFFYCFGKYPIVPTKNQCVVNLWHGMPLKTIGSLVESEEKNKQNYFTYVLSTSEFFRYHMQNAFQCKREQVIICGQPRNDDLFDSQIDVRKIFDVPEKSKLICYMPTFRKSDILGTNNTTSTTCLYEKLKLSKNLESLNYYLKQISAYLFVKPHPMDNYDKNFIKDLSNIIYVDDNILKHKNLNTYNFLGQTDALITDYSSVYFDYLLIDKPIGFIIDDLKYYGDIRGFVVEEPESIMPGKKIYNQDDLFSFCKDIAENIDDYKDERKKINGLVNYYKGKSNCQHLLKLIGLE